MSETPPPNPPQDASNPTSNPSAPGGAETPASGPPQVAPAATAAAVDYSSGQPVPDAADVEKNKLVAALSYVYILWLVPMLSAKDSPFAKFHCNQGILLSFILLLYFVLGVMTFIPYIGCLACVAWPVVLIAHLAFMILGIVTAVNGKMKPLPLFPVVNWVK